MKSFNLNKLDMLYHDLEVCKRSIASAMKQRTARFQINSGRMYPNLSETFLIGKSFSDCKIQEDKNLRLCQ